MTVRAQRRPRAARRPRSSLGHARDGGVAVVVGAVLVTMMILTTIVALRTSVAPAWQKEAEAQHMREVAGQFGTLSGELDRKVENASRSASLIPVTVGTPRSSVLAADPPGHRLALSSGLKNFTVAADKIRLQEVNGTPLTGLGEEWVDVDDGGSVDDIGSVHSLRIKVDRVSKDNNGDNLTLTLTGSDGAFAGDFELYVTNHPSGYNVNIKTRDKDGEVLYDQGDAYFLQDARSPYWVDVLEGRYRFKAVVTSTPTPLEIGMAVANVCPCGENKDLVADYAITYVLSSDQGVILTGGGGLLVDDFEETYPGRTLVYTGDNGEFVRQRLVLEHGAVVLDQADGSVLRSAPVFSAADVGSAVSLQIHVPTLRGTSDGLSGNAVVTLEARTINQRSFVAVASNITFTIDTDHPDLWAELLDERLAAAGLTSENCPPVDAADPCQYEVTENVDNVVVVVHGPVAADADPDDPEYDVAISFKQAAIRVDVTR